MQLHAAHHQHFFEGADFGGKPWMRMEVAQSAKTGRRGGWRLQMDFGGRESEI